MYWDETLDLEMSDIIDQCSKSDTDFEFVIDQSGSGMVFLSGDFVNSVKLCSHKRSLKVKQDNWDLTMDLISKEWIQKAIRPSDSKTCGNHVAGRKFSKNENKYQVRDLT